jgi:hypothetical protein
VPNNYKYSDFDIDFSKNDFTNDVAMKIDKGAVQQSIKNIILTLPGEKPFRRSFGVGIHSLLFENFSILDEVILKDDVDVALGQFEPRVVLDNLLIIPNNIDNNEINIRVDYYILNGTDSPIFDSITIALTKVR